MTDPFSSWFSAFNQSIGRFTYLPTTNWQRFFNPQMVFNFNPQDEAVEGHVLSKVGSYGSQLARIIDVIEVLVTQAGDAGLDAAQKEKIATFETLRKQADDAVKGYYQTLSADDLVAGAQAYKEAHPALAATLAKRIAEALDAKAATLVPKA